MIKVENGKYRYFDKYGVEITEGCKVRYPHGDKSLVRTKKVYLTENGFLGIDATNPVWIDKGWATPCEYGIYPFSAEETEEIEVVTE